MRTRCPACKKSSDQDDLQAGWTIVCLACGHPFVARFVDPDKAEDATAAASSAAVEPQAPEILSVLISEENAPKAAGGLNAGVVIFAGCLVCLFVLGVGFAAYGMMRAPSSVGASAPAIAGAARPSIPLPRPTVPDPIPAPLKRTPSATSPAAPTAPKTIPTPTTRSFALAAPSAPASMPSPSISQNGAVQRPETPPSDFNTTLKQPPRSRPPVKRPDLNPIALSKADLTDEQIGKAIQKGVDFLLEQFDSHTHLIKGLEMSNGSFLPGTDPLAVYALLQCSAAINDPRIDIHQPNMKELVNAMKGLPLHNYHWETYARSLRASALAIYNRPEDRQALSNDVTALLRGMHNGAYNYRLAPINARGVSTDADPARWDNSNAQYGLLGVWSGAEAGREVPQRYWEEVRRHWETVQLPTGDWCYLSGFSPSHSMTCAGLASLFVAHDYLEPAHFTGAVGREPYSPAVAKGLAWLEAGDTSINLDHGGYNLFGLERVGLASGFKYFGDHDWYRDLAKPLVASQLRPGSWGDTPARALYGPQIETSYALLFLSRGRHPIVMNKLRTAGHWANRPRDVENLARFAAHELERPLNWQVVPIDRPFTDWMDSPILYLASEKPVSISDAQVRNIREFINNGGMLFTQADGNSPSFTIFASQLARRLFPDYEMQDLPDNHPVYNVMFHVPPIAGMKYVTNGSRTLMLHSTTDISSTWEKRDNKFKPIPFQFGTNLFVFASGDQSLRNRLTSSYLPPVGRNAALDIKVARLSYAGNWDPEPAAWTRFSRWFSYQTGYGLTINTVAMKDLKPGDADIAVLTGAQGYDLTDAESSAIKAFTEAGGVVLIDTCGGHAGFDHTVESSLLLKSFASIHPGTVNGSHPLVSAGAPGMRALGTPKLRGFAVENLGTGAGYLKEIPAGQGHILYTTVDFTTALLGTRTAGIIGYDPDYAMGLLENVMLWTVDGQKDE